MDKPVFKPMKIDMSNGLTYAKYMDLVSEFNAKRCLDNTAPAEVTGTAIADCIRTSITLRQLSYLYYMQFVVVADPAVPVLATKEEYHAYLADKKNNCTVLHNDRTINWVGNTLKTSWRIVPADVLQRLGDNRALSMGYGETMLRYMYDAAMYHAYGELPFVVWHKPEDVKPEDVKPEDEVSGLEKARALLQQASDVMRAEIDGGADGVVDFIDDVHPQLATLIESLQLYLYPEPKDWRVTFIFNEEISAVNAAEARKIMIERLNEWAGAGTLQINANIEVDEEIDDSQRHG